MALYTSKGSFTGQVTTILMSLTVMRVSDSNILFPILCYFVTRAFAKIM